MTVAHDPQPRTPATGGDSNSNRRTGFDRLRQPAALAVCAAVLALAAALVASLGPASRERATYAWPPDRLTASIPSRGWFAPLPLLNRVPASIDLRVPCGLSPPLRGARQATVVATARRPRANDALNIERAALTLVIAVGTSRVASLPWPESCPLRIRISGGKVTLPSTTVELHSKALDHMPIVTGLFTNLDLRSGQAPEVAIQTRVYTTSWTARQWLAGFLMVVLMCTALFLLLRPRRWNPLAIVGTGIRTAWRARDLTDAVVVGVLLVWWIVAPTFTDDGWIWTELHAFPEVGTLAFYFDVWGVGLPTGYWFEWLSHLAIGSTRDLVVMRLPALLALSVTWVISRWSMRQVIGQEEGVAARWLLAGAFLVGAMAWGITLRLEPFVSVLVLASLAALLSFGRTPRLGPLVIAVGVVALAIPAHPVGLLAAAPLLASLPEVFSWLRRGRLGAAVPLGIVSVLGLALLVALFSLDADLGTRLDETRIARANDRHSYPWWQEYIRYTNFDRAGGGTAIRELSLALMVLSVAAWITRRRSAKTSVSTLPARAVAVALILLALVPSKWPWHFGAIGGVAAVATVTELIRLLREREYPGFRTLRPVLALGAIATIAAWAWSAPDRWGADFLRETGWSRWLDYHGRLVLVPVVAVALVILFLKLPRRRAIEWSAICALVIACFVVVSSTLAVLAGDAVVTAWSPARQAAAGLVGDQNCGLADELGPRTASKLRIHAGSVLVEPSVGLFFPCSRVPALEHGLVEVPSTVVLQSGPWVITKRQSPFAALSDLYDFKIVGRGPFNTTEVAVRPTIPGYARLDPELASR